MANAKKKTEVKFPEVAVSLRLKKTKNALTVNEAKELIGWQEEPKG